MAYFSEEDILEARKLDLLTYLKLYEPRELVRVSGNTYSTKEHDSLKISNGKWMWWSHRIGGVSALDYLTRISVCDDIYRILKKEEKTAILVTHDLSEAISVADRIIILSARPATIKKIVPVHLTLEERTPLSSRSAPEYKEYFNLIWKELK